MAVVLAGLRPGNRPGGKRHSRSGEGGRGEDADVAWKAGGGGKTFALAELGVPGSAAKPGL
jgi:hypothetical protein